MRLPILFFNLWGFAFAQFNLGAMYVRGKGITKDEAKVVKWFRKAADQGDARAQEVLRSHGLY